MAKVLTKDDVAAACEKAAAKATAAERKRCIAAVKSVDLTDVTKPKAVVGLAVSAIKEAE